MEKFIYTQITNKNYLGIITILDYEISIQKCLARIFVPVKVNHERKVLVDLALKVGINKYRFIVCDVTGDGNILVTSGRNIIPNTDIIELANSFIRQRYKILSNSMLSSCEQVLLLKKSSI